MQESCWVLNHFNFKGFKLNPSLKSINLSLVSQENKLLLAPKPYLLLKAFSLQSLARRELLEREREERVRESERETEREECACVREGHRTLNKGPKTQPESVSPWANRVQIDRFVGKGLVPKRSPHWGRKGGLVRGSKIGPRRFCPSCLAGRVCSFPLESGPNSRGPVP